MTRGGGGGVSLAIPCDNPSILSIYLPGQYNPQGNLPGDLHNNPYTVNANLDGKFNLKYIRVFELFMSSLKIK